mmetsp:Transcript_45567/g.89753  ORF Transcript_45567/g.89753 Transcript_45567/m.89753 type:complete len:236 (-) Transcript_45567:340-1047(-)
MHACTYGQSAWHAKPPNDFMKVFRQSTPAQPNTSKLKHKKVTYMPLNTQTKARTKQMVEKTKRTFMHRWPLRKESYRYRHRKSRRGDRGKIRERSNLLCISFSARPHSRGETQCETIALHIVFRFPLCLCFTIGLRSGLAIHALSSRSDQKRKNLQGPSRTIRCCHQTTNHWWTDRETARQANPSGRSALVRVRKDRDTTTQSQSTHAARQIDRQTDRQTDGQTRRELHDVLHRW